MKSVLLHEFISCYVMSYRRAVTQVKNVIGVSMSVISKAQHISSLETACSCSLTV